MEVNLRHVDWDFSSHLGFTLILQGSLAFSKCRHSWACCTWIRVVISHLGDILILHHPWHWANADCDVAMFVVFNVTFFLLSNRTKVFCSSCCAACSEHCCITASCMQSWCSEFQRSLLSCFLYWTGRHLRGIGFRPGFILYVNIWPDRPQSCLAIRKGAADIGSGLYLSIRFCLCKWCWCVCNGMWVCVCLCVCVFLFAFV